jgi:hypothetical protein
MENRIDLDKAAAVLEHRLVSWQKRGLSTGRVTWRDEGNTAVLTVDRSSVRNPDSIGVHVRLGKQEGQLVLFKGGWADLEYWSGDIDDPPILEAPGWDDWLDLGRLGSLLDDFSGRFQSA